MMKKNVLATFVMGISVLTFVPAVMADGSITTSSTSDIFWSKHFDPATLKNGAVIQQKPYVVFTTVDGKDTTPMDYGYVLEYVGYENDPIAGPSTFWKSEQVSIVTGDVMGMMPAGLGAFPLDAYPDLKAPSDGQGVDFGNQQPPNEAWGTGIGLNVKPIPNWNPLVKGSNMSGFSDVPNSDENVQYITDLHNKGLIDGTGAGAFSPNDPLTREQFAKMVVEAFGIPKSTTKVPFTDLPSNSWSAPYVQAAYAAGVTAGTGENQFSPTQPLKREEAATMVWRWLIQHGVTPAADASDFSSPSDDWAKDSVSNIMAYGMRAEGVSKANYASREVMFRGDAAALIDSAMLRMNNK